MKSNEILRCDGCGQMGSPEHIARRLRRLEWATRFRPVHIQTLLLGGVAPREDAEFLYTPSGGFRGKAEALLRAVGISCDGKPAQSVHAEFQAAGFFLAHILECPLEDGPNGANDSAETLRKHLAAVAARIRRSLKPKRVTLVTEMPQEVVQDILSLDLGCPIVLDNGKPFRICGAADGARFRALLAAGGRDGTERKGKAGAGTGAGMGPCTS